MEVVQIFTDGSKFYFTDPLTYAAAFDKNRWFSVYNTAQRSSYGPSYITNTGECYWKYNYKYHREDGPAVYGGMFGTSGRYFLYGKHYPEIKSDEEWLRFQKLKAFE